MKPVTLEQARAFLHAHVGEPLGAHVEDFRKDRFAWRYASAALPIPEILEIGEAFGGYFAIAPRAYGAPLEEVDTQTWRRVTPALAAALEAMRMADITATTGFGDWNAAGQASATSWSDHLLAVAEDAPASRIHGWRRKLETASPEGVAAFAWGFARLQQLVSDAIPRSLLHCDLMNRNVLVDDGRITALIDWGCARYGDHLYDLAWFEFWAPWHPQLDATLLRAELERSWRRSGYTPDNMTRRLAACHLHIGLDHLAYNAHLGAWEMLAAVAARMKSLVEATP